MPRYIDADALKSYLNEREYADMYYIEALFGIIDRQSTVSPDDVRGVCISNPSEGVWLPVPDKIGDCLYKCSQCGFVRDAYVLDIGNYCPNCGARLTGGEND